MLAERLVADTGDNVRAILLYGSRLLKTNPDPNSALDFVVVVSDYQSFYQKLSDAGMMHRPVRLMTWMAGRLAPNVIAYLPDGEGGGIAKCLIVDRAHLRIGLGPTPPDHFLLGRLIQRVGFVWSDSDATEAEVRGWIQGAHSRVIEWMAPYLERPVDAEGLGRRLLEVCYQGEFRPESRGRASSIFEAQADHFRGALQPGLDAAVTSGQMVRADGLYSVARPVPPSETRKWHRHFRRSKARTTMRWFKHMITFANWLPYVQRKVERHSGRKIHLTTLERKLPILFLWPRAIHVLVTRPKREVVGRGADPSTQEEA